MHNKLITLFNDLDNDLSGKITMEELMDSPPEVLKTLEYIIPVDDLGEVAIALRLLCKALLSFA